MNKAPDLNELIRKGYMLSFNDLNILIDDERKIVFFLPLGQRPDQQLIDAAMKVKEARHDDD